MASQETVQLQQASAAPCDSMDQAQAGLCHVSAHGEVTKRTADNPALPEVPPFAATSVIVVPAPAHEVQVIDRRLVPPLLLRTTAPPLAIRHCCFRI